MSIFWHSQNKIPPSIFLQRKIHCWTLIFQTFEHSNILKFQFLGKYYYCCSLFTALLFIVVGFSCIFSSHKIPKFSSLIINQIEDSIVSNIDDNIKDICLRYGDINVFRNKIQETHDTTTNRGKTSAERAEHLKKHKLKRPHAGKKDCQDWPITVQKSCNHWH